MRTIKRLLLFSMMSIMMIYFCAGCWDNRDVTEINFVTAAGLSRNADGQIEITVEIPKSSKVQTSGDSSGGGSAGSSSEKAVSIFSCSGDTVFDAVRNSLKTLDKKLYWTQMELLIVGEDVAKEGLADVLDFLERDPEANIISSVIIAKGIDIRELMELESSLQKIPSMHLINNIRTNQRGLGSSMDIRLIDVLREIQSDGKDPAIPVIQLEQKTEKPDLIKDLKIEGSAVIRQDKLIGYLTPEETRGLLIINNQAKSSIYTIPSPFGEEKKIAIEMHDSKGKKKVRLIDGEVNLDVEVKVYGDLGETQYTGDITSPERIGVLTAEMEKRVQEELETTIQKAQAYQADIFGFGEIFHRQYPDEWKKNQEHWEEIFSNCSVRVQVEVIINKSGYIKQGNKPA